MKIPKKKALVTREKAKGILGYLTESYRDYLASRILFNNNELIQACCLANTSIEKIFKALLIQFEGKTVKYNHDLNKLLPDIEKYDLEIFNSLNIDFLKSISYIYKTRYIGSEKTGYNIVILRNKFMAELDYTYSILEPKIRVGLQSLTDKIITPYEADKMRKLPALIKNNYILLDDNKTNLIEHTTEFVLELRIYKNSVFEATYSTNKSKDDGIFNFESLKPSDDMGLSFKVCFPSPDFNDIYIIHDNRLLIGPNTIKNKNNSE
ncbi:HEPN domain-containing protein [Flavivirga amylovorans]|uniref:HEPN domain-containing protein n=1 Tax=Flavivirga amylovorans TaxID=870486 RepID=A0ABT8X6A7_9FLAO|nr:HEPN domain-containing protein [Flavivirga amylovorans]MDO5989523.1 HEPN domain-containing protein [Flavivirga amylovorans]